MVRAGGDERSVTLPQFQTLSVNVEQSPSFKNDVELVGGVHALMVRFGSDERIDADLEECRLMDDLETACFGRAQARLGPVDVEGVSRL
jgi:hypothetical protein